MKSDSVLGRLSPARFLRDHWQKRPLLVRQALPGFAGLLDRDELLRLATRPDAISRLVIDHERPLGRGRERRRPSRRQRWERHDGPFAALDASMLPDERWTVLVHGVESLVPGGWELLRRFHFLPAARIDDLMVSYAAPGGSVGPHQDRYDVFLLQGPGRRRWQLSTGGDPTLDESAAIKVLKHFRPDEEWVLEPGDMLYLPPGVQHYGVADGPCFTYSIGFLAPSHRELVESFLGWLGGAVTPALSDELLGDPDLLPVRDPLMVGDQMVAQVAAVLDGVRWDRRLVEDFLGCFLTRPKPQVRFHPPARPLSREQLGRQLRGRARLTLALPSRGLVRRGRLYLNGEAYRASRATLEWFRQLVTERSLSGPLRLDDHALELTHTWYAAGWLGTGWPGTGSPMCG